MSTSIIGFPRIGENRELKRATEKYWKKEINQEELLKISDEQHQLPLHRPRNRR